MADFVARRLAVPGEDLFIDKGAGGLADFEAVGEQVGGAAAQAPTTWALGSRAPSSVRAWLRVERSLWMVRARALWLMPASCMACIRRVRK